jgi:hypothetical protein
MSKPKAQISIHEIRCALSVDVALGHMTQEQADHVIKCLMLDWKEDEYNKRNDMECFISDFRELLEKYEAQIHLKGNCDITFYTNFGLSGPRTERLNLGSGVGRFIDAEYAALFPKILKRQKMVHKIDFPTTTHIDDIKPIFEAIRKVDRKSHFYVTDKKFAEMLKPYKPKKK